MSSINYMKNKKVRDYYERWVLNPFLTGRDKEEFYKFVKACLEVDRRPDIDYLKAALYDSFFKKYDANSYSEFTDEIIILFEHLRDFYNTTLP